MAQSGDSLFAEGMDITFSGVNIGGPAFENKTILHGLDGCARAGRLTAIMGPTGSGKTTLLNALAHRLRLSSGDVNYGGYSWSKALQRRVGFVEQDDIVYPDLTVRESLMFDARLRLPAALTPAARRERVEDVISQLRLGKSSDTRVGDAASRGISGGERKRTCIARELLLQPAVLFLDEPTSGLDSTMARTVVAILKELAAASVNVCTTIHQPSSQVFAMFDDLLLLDEGKVVFSGPGCGAVEFFSDLGFPCPPLYNPADHFMDLVVNAPEDGGLDAAARGKVQLLKPGSCSDVEGGQDEKFEAFPAGMRRKRLKEATADRYAVSYCTQVAVLTERTARIVRAQVFTATNVVLNAALALLAGLLWLNLGTRESDIFERMSLLFWIVGTWTFFPTMGSLPTFPSSAVALKKELSVGAYRLSAFFISRTVCIAPLEHASFATLYVPIVYGMTLPNPSVSVFFQVLLAVYLNIAMMHSVGLAISAGVQGPKAFTACILIITFWFGYGGLFVSVDAMPEWLAWCQHVNLISYSHHLLMNIVFTEDLVFNCAGPDSTGSGPASAYPSCVAAAAEARCNGSESGGGGGGGRGIITRVDILQAYGVWRSAELCVVSMMAFTVGLRVLAYALLRNDTRQEVDREDSDAEVVTKLTEKTHDTSI